MFDGGVFQVALTHGASVYDANDGCPTIIAMYSEGYSDIGIWGIDETDGLWTFVPWPSVSYVTKDQ